MPLVLRKNRGCVPGAEEERGTVPGTGAVAKEHRPQPWPWYRRAASLVPPQAESLRDRNQEQLPGEPAYPVFYYLAAIIQTWL